MISTHDRGAARSGDPGVPFAVWLDSPARLNRLGRAERAAPSGSSAGNSRARDVLMPHSPGAAAALPPGAAPSVLVPPPIPVAPVAGDSRPRAVRGRVHARPEGQGPRAAVRGVGAGRAAGGAAADRRHRPRAGARVPDAAAAGVAGRSGAGRDAAPAVVPRPARRGRACSSARRRGRTSGSRRSRRSTAARCSSARRPAGRSRRWHLARSLAPEFVAADRDAGTLARALEAAFAAPTERAGGVPERGARGARAVPARGVGGAASGGRAAGPARAVVDAGAPPLLVGLLGGPSRPRRPPPRPRSANASTSLPSVSRSIARLSAPIRRRRSGSETTRSSAPATSSTLMRIDQQRVAAVDRHVAGGAGGLGADDREARRGRLADRHPERLVGADQRVRVGRGVEVGQLVGRQVAVEADGDRRAGGELLELVLQEAGADDLELGPRRRSPARANASISVPKFLSGTRRPTLMILTGLVARLRFVRRRPRAERLDVGGLERDRDPLVGDAEREQPLRGRPSWPRSSRRPGRPAGGAARAASRAASSRSPACTR